MPLDERGLSPTFARMSALRHPASKPTLLHRLLAAGGAALVLALTVFAASPKLHDWLHATDDCNDGDSCPVVLFAHGVASPVAIQAEPPPLGDCRSPAQAEPTPIFLAAPRYLRQPERGPPVRLVS